MSKQNLERLIRQSTVTGSNRAGARKSGKTELRMFDAAKQSRLTNSWVSSPQMIDSYLVQHLNILKARAREQSVNNDYAKRFINLCRSNIVGPKGVTLQARSKDPDGKLDSFANLAIEKAWNKFRKKKNCSVCGKLSFKAIEKLAISNFAIDGEFIIKKVPMFKHNEFRFALQVIDSILLDVTLNTKLRNGNTVKMGIELNPWGRPVNYYFLSSNTDHSATVLVGRYYRVEKAENIIHGYIHEYAGQTRGIPAMAVALLRLNMLHGFEDAAVVAARVGASKLGWFKGQGFQGDDVDPEGNILEDAEPGEFGQLAEDTEFVEWSPDYPHANYGPFMKTCLRGISSGLNVSYISLANDLEGVSFSSIRTGVLEDREHWKGLQEWLIYDELHEDVYESWLRMQILTGSIKLGSGTLRPELEEKYQAVFWQPRRWSWVDPLKDLQAAKLAIDMGVATVSEFIRERGFDPITVWEERQSELAILAEKKIPVDQVQVLTFMEPKEDA